MRKYCPNLNYLLRAFVCVVVIVTSAFLSAPSSYAAAGINRTINFQGKLVNADGTNVADSTYTVVFSLYTVSSGGANIWTESDSVTTKDGVFRVALGAGTAFSNVDFNQDTLWMGIKVGSDAEMTPRVQFTAVPYAFNADKLDGVVATNSASQFTLSGSTNGLQTLTVNGNITVGSTIQPTSPGGLTVQSNGANSLTLDTGGAQSMNIGTTANALIFGATNNPTYAFNGTGTFGTSTGQNNLNGNVLLASNKGLTFDVGSGSINFNVKTGTGGTTAGLIVKVDTTASQVVTAANTDTNNAVGVATTTTSAGSNATIAVLGVVTAVADNTVTVGDYIGMGSTTGGRAKSLGATYPTTSNIQVLGRALTAATAGSNFTLLLNGLDNNTGTAGGSNFWQQTVANGLTYLSPNPTSQLVVVGATTGLANAGLDVEVNSKGNATSVVNNTGGAGDIFTASSAGATKFVIDKSGNVGVGTSTPRSFLDIGDVANAILSVGGPNNGGYIQFSTSNNQISYASQELGIYTDQPNGLNFYTNGTSNRMRIDANGFVGIGNTSMGNASLVVNQTNASGAIFTASSAGTTKYRLTKTNALYQEDIISSIGNGGSGNGSNAVTNAIGDEGSLVPNAGFESGVASSGAMFADGWTAAATSSGATVRDTVSSPAKGAASAKVTLGANQTTAFYSACIPLALSNGLGSYNLIWYTKGSSTIPIVRGYIDSYQTKANCQADSGGTVTVSAPQTAVATSTSWNKMGGSVVISNLNSGTWGRAHIFVGCLATCSANTTVNIDAVRIIESALTNGVDYAENYPADLNNTPQPGDVVALASLNGSAAVKIADRPMDTAAIGVVSTNPGEVLDDGNISDPKVAVALAGRIPTKVSTKNGAIHIGDYLTSSDIPGVAIKAISAGQVIGTAMEDDTDIDATHTTKIIMFVKNTYYDGGLNSIFASKTGQDVLQFLGKLASEAEKTSSSSAIASLVTNSVDGLHVLTNQTTPSSLNNSVNLPTLSATASGQTTADLLTTNGLLVNNFATISGDLRVKGSGLFEGVLSIIDTLKANNFIATGLADFFNVVNFRNDVNFTGRPTFNKDTAGFAIIKKGSNSVTVTFEKAYESAPIVNATLSIDELTPIVHQANSGTLEQKIFSSGYAYIITKRTEKGFTIVLNKEANDDITFSWIAIGVNEAKTYQNSGRELLSPVPTPEVFVPLTSTPPFTGSSSAHLLIN